MGKDGREMTAKHALALVCYSLVCLGLSLIIAECPGRKAKRDIQEARAEASALRANQDLAHFASAAISRLTNGAFACILRATVPRRPPSGAQTAGQFYSAP